MLELVGDRAAVGLAELRQNVGERLARHVDTQDRRGNARLQLRRELRLEPQRLERRVADGLRPERVEPCGEVAVRAVRLDERHGRSDPAEQLRIGRGLRDRNGDRRRVRGLGVAVPLRGCGGRQGLEQACDPRVGRDQPESPLSKSARHSDGTASGFSRYSSSRARA